MPLGFPVGGPPKPSILRALRRRLDCRKGRHVYSADWFEFWTESDSATVWCVNCHARAEKTFAELGPAFESKRRHLIESMANVPPARG